MTQVCCLCGRALPPGLAVELKMERDAFGIGLTPQRGPAHAECALQALTGELASSEASVVGALRRFLRGS